MRTVLAVMALGVMPSAAWAGCRGAVNDTLAAWRSIAVQVPTSTGSMDNVNAAVKDIQAHGAVLSALLNARPKRNRHLLTGAVEQAEDWMDANDDAVGLDLARTSLGEVATACGLPPTG